MLAQRLEGLGGGEAVTAGRGDELVEVFGRIADGEDHAVADEPERDRQIEVAEGPTHLLEVLLGNALLGPEDPAPRDERSVDGEGHHLATGDLPTR